MTAVDWPVPSCLPAAEYNVGFLYSQLYVCLTHLTADLLRDITSG